MNKLISLRIREQRTHTPLMQNVLNACYTALVIACFFVFFKFFNFELLGYKFSVPLSIIPYTFLYPISYVVLRLYGYRQINNMIVSMFFASMLLVIIIRILNYYSNFDLFTSQINLNQNIPSELNAIISSSMYMYIAGLIAMPLSIYGSFYVLKLLKHFNVFTLSIATAIGEIINTYIVFPIGLHQHFGLHDLFSSVIISATIVKVIFGIFLSILTILFLKIYE